LLQHQRAAAEQGAILSHQEDMQRSRHGVVQKGEARPRDATDRTTLRQNPLDCLRARKMRYVRFVTIPQVCIRRTPRAARTGAC
jgi:hypothetical protein